MKRRKASKKVQRLVKPLLDETSVSESEPTVRLDQSNRSRESARPEEDIVHAILSAMTDPLVIYNSDGIITRANDTAKTAFGFDPTGMRQQQILQEIDLRFPDGRSMNRSEGVV